MNDKFLSELRLQLMIELRKKDLKIFPGYSLRTQPIAASSRSTICNVYNTRGIDLFHLSS